MSPAILEASAAVSGSVITPQRNLIALTEKLASLRYLIILTARWEGSDTIGRERRVLMNRDLVNLRREYSEVIDDIAIACGVQAAMDAQHLTERNVMVPRDIQPPSVLEDEDGYGI